MSVGNGSRLPALIEALERANRSGDRTILKNIVERAADPRDFLSDPDRLQTLIEYLNARRSYEGLELQREGQQVRLGAPGRSTSVVDALVNAVVVIDFDTVSRDLDRALASAKTDPEDAVTSACSVVESVCRSVLVELGGPLPAKKDVQGLYQAVREPLGLMPDKQGVADDIANDVRTILGGLNSIVNGIGSLRTHAGDAHGRERGYRRIDSRIARLAIHSARVSADIPASCRQEKASINPRARRLASACLGEPGAVVLVGSPRNDPMSSQLTQRLNIKLNQLLLLRSGSRSIAFI
jgi:Abortive infection C-terminus